MDIKTTIDNANSLQEALQVLYRISPKERTAILAEAMTGKTAEEYDSLGRINRRQTYQRIVEDFKNRTDCYGINHLKRGMNIGTIIDVGCGSGLLSLELAEQTNGSILGIDLSSEMLVFTEKNRKEREQERKEKRDHYLKIQEGSNIDATRNDDLFSFLKRVTFQQGSVYDLPQLLQNKSDTNYIVCRNALHRFRDPTLAIEKMYESLSDKGKLYLRDLRRDAPWSIIRERIGKARWDSTTLVQDYIGAMAGMLRTPELEKIIQSLGIKDYTISDGSYQVSQNVTRINSESLQEYQREVEYVCVIKKSLPHH